LSLLVVTLGTISNMYALPTKFYSFETDLAWQVDLRFSLFEIKTRSGLKKIKKKLKTWLIRRVDLIDSARPGQKLNSNSLTIYFFNQNDVVLISKKNKVDSDDQVKI
jgi:hypothetical protein